MFRLEGGRPGDRRGFVHKRLVGGLKGLLSGGPTGALTGFLTKPKPRATVPRTTTARPTAEGQRGKELARFLKFGEGVVGTFGPASITKALAPPPPPARSRLPFGGGRGGTSPCRSGESARCCQLRNGDFNDQRQWQRECGVAGNGARDADVGEAVMGRYGAALEPGLMMIERSVCLPGMQLGNDGLCYNKGSITNSQRQWPRGRRPLLTGGDMRAIGIAARAGSKLDRTTKRLRSLGMMKALPKPARARAHAHAKPISAVSV